MHAFMGQRRHLALLLGLSVLGACGAQALPRTNHAAIALRGLAPLRDPAVDLDDDDDLERVRAAYDALLPTDPLRSSRRRELLSAYQRRIAGALAKNLRDEAFSAYQSALGMWAPEELHAETADLSLVLADSRAIYDSFAGTGGDLEAITALAVLISAEPSKAASYEKTYREIVSYLDDLSIADAGEGAQRARPIEILESVTAHFPSRWAGNELIQLYLSRQAAVYAAIQQGGSDLGVLRAHKEGVVRPVWNLIRVFARLHRLGDALPVVDPLAQQVGDEPELRSRLRIALSPGVAAQAWLALAVVYLPEGERQAADLDVAESICAAGAAALPQSSEPRKCAGEIAALARKVPTALRWMESAWAIDPQDRETASALVRLYGMELGELAFAERLGAARQKLVLLEDFHAKARERWPKKSIDPPLAAAYLTMGRALYNMGLIEDAIGFLKKALTIKPTAEAFEQLGTIHAKHGEYPQAIKSYMAATALPRESDLEQTFDRARLLRLAGESHLLSGDKDHAHKLFRQAMDDWASLLAADLPSRIRSESFTEKARLLYAMGRTADSLVAFDAAVDTDPEQPSVYSDVIAFLIARGHYAEALDAYHRALGRQEVSEYFKVYTSLWIIDAARIRGLRADPLAVEFLGAQKGTRWFHELARFTVGEITYEELLGKADTRGKRAEAYFYAAMHRYATGDRKGAETLLQYVLSTDMLGFFEYDMALYFLKHGPPTAG
jgi:tetratricopeptide (TPR) repeat protein